MAPQPWLAKAGRPDWTSVYYHKADSVGLGFDRTATGSNALALYSPGRCRSSGATPATCPLDYLLWFHHVGWKQRLTTGRTLWDELVTRYYTGADSVTWMQQRWASVKPAVDPALHADVTARLQIQRSEALWWRDACVLYFQTYSKQPIPAPFTPPTRTLAEVKEPGRPLSAEITTLCITYSRHGTHPSTLLLRNSGQPICGQPQLNPCFRWKASWR